MSQAPKLTRVRQLADSVWPGRTVDGYANLIATRLRKLAAARSTGMLPVSGRGDGAIFFRDGQVVYAESSRTPAPSAPRAGLAALGLAPMEASQSAEPGAMTPGVLVADGASAGGVLVAAPSLRRLTELLALTEPTVDALTDLLSNDSRYSKFRPDVFSVTQHGLLPVGSVLTEVERRRQVLRQLAPVVTPDTPVVKSGLMDSPCLQVSAPQWALLVRVGEGATPRSLALTMNRSVFGTTIEIHRLLALGLLTVAGRRPAAADSPGAHRPGPVVSFMRAVSDAGGGGGERGSDA